jgi:lipopolysaccharide assembly protein A
MSDATDRPVRRKSGFLTPQRITAGVLTLIALVFVLQNRDDVTLQFVGFQITATLWFASLALLVTGVLIGVLWTSRRQGP